jgi:hypothetical protein
MLPRPELHVSSQDPSRERWTLHARQRRFERRAAPPWAASDRAARLLSRPVPTAREDTRRRDESFLDPPCADTGVWPDHAEGGFETGDESYDEARRKQFDLIVHRTGAGSGTRRLDLG